MKFNYKQFKKKFLVVVSILALLGLSLNLQNARTYYSQFTSKERIQEYFDNNEVIPNGTMMLGTGGETVVFLTTTGAGTWTVPADCQSATIECIGGGGGGNQTIYGGGGGAYSKKNNLTLTPGTSISYNVGVGTNINGGDTWFKSTSDVFAQGGAGGSNTLNGGRGNGTGGLAANCVGDVKYSGGTASTKSNLGSGGGAAGLHGDGNGGNGYTNGGQGDLTYGGLGGLANQPGQPGTEWSSSPTYGSGGGGCRSYQSGGLYGGGGGDFGFGAQGIVVITYTPAVSGNSNFFMFF